MEASPLPAVLITGGAKRIGAVIAQAFADALGAQADEELDAALAADDARPTVHLLARPGEITAEELALVTGGEPAPYSPYGVHLEPGGGDVGDLDAVREGLAVVQDEGSQLVALALTRVPVDGDGHRWLDLCAGPGGKAALLGGLDRTWAGLSVTMPLKHAVLTLMDDVAPLARAVGAVNTVVVRDHDGVSLRGDSASRVSLRGDNTDVHGMVAALREGGVDQVESACVLGAGATAASAIAAGSSSAQRAFMTGRLRVGGDLRVLLAHGEALAQLDDVFAGVRARTAPVGQG